MLSSAVSASSAAFIFIFLLGHSNASSYFKPQCPVPPPGTNYVAGANTRSTLGILWDFLSMIILCTWNIQHLNVPAIQRRPDTMLGRTWQTILNSRVKIKWMIFTIFVPEFLVGKAFGERVAGKWGWGRKNLARGYLANMGYFVLHWKDDTDGEIEEPIGYQPGLPHEAAKSATAGTNGSGLQVDNTTAIGTAEAEPPTSATRTNMTNILGAIDFGELQSHEKLNLQRLQSSNYWALDSVQWWRCKDYGVATLDDVPQDQLQRLDRGGTLVKSLALLQVSYLIVQLVARKLGDLPSTQLEITALAFAASSIITYLLYWNRPQGVETIHVIEAKEVNVKGWNTFIKLLINEGPRYLWYTPRFAAKFDPTIGPAPIPNDCSYYNSVFSWRDIYGGNDEILYLAGGSLAGGSIFGGLHCLAWNFDFPTPAEQLLWRICSVMITCLPPLAILPLGLWMRLNPVLSNLRRGSPLPLAKAVVASILISLFLVPYVLARLFLLVEVFRSLFFLPPEAFVETWSGSFPHWG